MTRQEVFNLVANKLLAQGKPALSEEQCQYRGSDGSKCAAGWLIPDDEYLSRMEGNNASSIADVSVTLEKIMASVGDEFLDALQTAHDGGPFMIYTNLHNNIDYPEDLQEKAAYYPTNWVDKFKGRMRFLANHYGLDASAVV